MIHIKTYKEWVSLNEGLKATIDKYLKTGKVDQQTFNNLLKLDFTNGKLLEPILKWYTTKMVSDKEFQDETKDAMSKLKPIYQNKDIELNRNLFTYTSPKELSTTISSIYTFPDLMDYGEGPKPIKNKDFEILQDDDNVTVLKINTFDASKYFGYDSGFKNNREWCTSKYSYSWENYYGENTMIMTINKKLPHSHKEKKSYLAINIYGQAYDFRLRGDDSKYKSTWSPYLKSIGVDVNKILNAASVINDPTLLTALSELSNINKIAINDNTITFSDTEVTLSDRFFKKLPQKYNLIIDSQNIEFKNVSPNDFKKIKNFNDLFNRFENIDFRYVANNKFNEFYMKSKNVIGFYNCDDINLCLDIISNLPLDKNIKYSFRNQDYLKINNQFLKYIDIKNIIDVDAIVIVFDEDISTPLDFNNQFISAINIKNSANIKIKNAKPFHVYLHMDASKIYDIGKNFNNVNANKLELNIHNDLTYIHTIEEYADFIKSTITNLNIDKIGKINNIVANFTINKDKVNTELDISRYNDTLRKLISTLENELSKKYNKEIKIDPYIYITYFTE